MGYKVRVRRRNLLASDSTNKLSKIIIVVRVSIMHIIVGKYAESV